jgi:transcriptional regulator with XRE-family HTH domain
MDFSQPEIIQILRRRLRINQSELGVKAFNTSPESGRTKVKNIELGKQIPTYKDLKKLAIALNVQVTDLFPEQTSGPLEPQLAEGEHSLMLHSQLTDMFPGLGDYLSVLNKAVVLGDVELVNYTCRKITDVLSNKSRLAVNQ